jgi:SpoVK/Ycf46/Vps4 family AAA+-type ATPase
VGPPGSGKSALAAAVAADLNEQCGTCGQFDCAAHDGEAYDEVVKYDMHGFRQVHERFRSPDDVIRTAIECARKRTETGEAVVLHFDVFEPLANDDWDDEIIDIVIREFQRLQSIDKDVFVVGTVCDPTFLAPSVRAPNW